MTTRVIVLNGASSSGTTSIARRLQTVVPGTRLAFGIDTLITAMPHPADDVGGVPFARDSRVSVPAAFGRAAESRAQNRSPLDMQREATC